MERILGVQLKNQWSNTDSIFCQHIPGILVHPGRSKGWGLLTGK